MWIHVDGALGLWAAASERHRHLMDGCEVLARPVINQGLVRFTAADGDHDRRTDAIVERIRQEGTTWFGASTFKGKRVMRTPVLSLSHVRGRRRPGR